MNKEIKDLMFWSAFLIGLSVWGFTIRLTDNGGSLNDELALAISSVILMLGIYSALKTIVLAITGAAETEKVSA